MCRLGRGRPRATDVLNVRLCLRLLLVASGISFRGYLEFKLIRKKPYTLTHVHANVRLRLRLLLVTSGVSARGYPEFMKSLVE